MTDSEKPSHWNSLADELGVEAAPRPAKPAAAPPPPVAKKKPPATPAANKPKSSWDDVANVLGVEVPPRPPKPVPPVAAPQPPKLQPPKPVPPAAASAECEAAPEGMPEVEVTRPQRGREAPRRDGGHRESASRDRGGQKEAGGQDRGSREGSRGQRGRRGGGRDQGERGGPRDGGADRGRGQRDQLAEPPDEKLLSDEMVSADFVDELVLAEEEGPWVGEEGASSRAADTESDRPRRRRRRRGGRRTRESSSTIPREAARELDDDEASEETEHIEELVDAIEASSLAEPDDREPLEKAVAAQDMDEKRRGKRRRRRGGRGRDAERGPPRESSTRDIERGESDTELDEADEPARQRHVHDDELDDELSDRAISGRDISDSDLEGDDEDHEGHDMRPSHRAIPSWDETIGVIVSANMEARAKNPHSGGSARGRARGQRGRGRRP
jgi:hypothetical protein